MAVDEDDDDADVMPLTSSKEEEGGEEDMISMALRMAEEMSGPIADLESAVEAVPINTGWFCVPVCCVSNQRKPNITVTERVWHSSDLLGPESS